jgi:hypothetical protein
MLHFLCYPLIVLHNSLIALVALGGGNLRNGTRLVSATIHRPEGKGVFFR